MANANGWVKPIVIGVAILVLGAVIVGSTTATITNTVARSGMEVKVDTIKEDVRVNTEKTQGIDVMASQITDIKQDVGKILEKMDK